MFLPQALTIARPFLQHDFSLAEPVRHLQRMLREGDMVFNSTWDADVRYLSKISPEYMLPQHYNFYAELPKTPSGKIDRVCLSSEVLARC
jgi:hypothetical protein